MRLVAAVVLLLPALAQAAEPARWLPGRCAEVLEISEEHRSAQEPPRDAESRWNESYRASFAALAEDDLDLAELELCSALDAAREFGPRDWRFAETLDELGLVSYRLGEDELAERMQGAAVAEMLLALGPEGDSRVALPKDCRSSVSVYLGRLGIIQRELEKTERTNELRAAPWLVFDDGHVPLDADLADRLKWLVTQYLLAENMQAAEDLEALRADILEAERLDDGS